MQENIDKTTPDKNSGQEYKQLYSKILTISGYIVAMRSDKIKEDQKTEEALKALIKGVYDIKTSIWICLITLWFLVILFLRKSF